MNEINMPFLSLQTDYTKGNEGQLLTRIQAFLEMIDQINCVIQYIRTSKL